MGQLGEGRLRPAVWIPLLLAAVVVVLLTAT
jgi:hypothetical protein